MLTHNIAIARRTTYALMIAAAIVQAPSKTLAETITGNETLSADRIINDLTLKSGAQIDLQNNQLTLGGSSTIETPLGSASAITGNGNLVVGAPGTTPATLSILGTTDFTGTTLIKSDTTVRLDASKGLRGSSAITVENGGTLVNEAASEIDGIDVQTGGTLELKDSLNIGSDGGTSTITGTLDSKNTNGGLVIKGDTVISGQNDNFGGGLQIRGGAELILSATNAIGMPDTPNFSTVSINPGSGLSIQAPNAINPGRELRVESNEGSNPVTYNGSTLLIGADQTIASLYSEAESTIALAANTTLTLKTADGSFDSLSGNITGSGNFTHAGSGKLEISPFTETGQNVGGTTNFTGVTTVNGGGTLYLERQDALGDTSQLSISNGSKVIIQTSGAGPDALPYDNAINTSAHVDLDLVGDSEATLALGHSQTIDSLTMGENAKIEIKDGKTFTVGNGGGDSIIEGMITFPGEFKISGGTTTVESTGDLESGLTAGDAVTLVNNGTISGDQETVASTIDGSDNSTAHDLKITNAGTIEATVNNDALYLRDSDRAEITNSGTIEADGSTGINLKLSDRADIRNSGDILAGDNNGIFIEDSTNAYIENSGTIRAGTDDGIDLENSKDAEVVNLGAGTIQANNNDAVLLKNSERASVTNAGTIKALGATGLHIGDADQASIINSGNIIAGTNNGLYGERSTNSYIENSGKIEAGSDDGIDLEDSSNAQVINSGTISAAGEVGINLIGSTNAQVTNSGTISATGNNGILLKGSTGARIENTGLISANRNAVDASDPDTVVNATIINSGVLRTQSETVELNGNHVLRNSGTIEATGAGETAIRAGADGGAVVILEKGSKIIGDISSGSADNTLRINVGSAQSVMYDTTGDWTLESLDGRPVVDGSVMAAGVGNLETVDERMHRHSVDLRNSISRLAGQRIMAPGAPILVDV